MNIKINILIGIDYIMKEFFKNIKFTYGTKDSEIKPSKIIISENEKLTKKLKGYVYVFDSPAQTNCSFYVITVPLSEKDLFELRRYIWNENKYDLYFLAEKPESDFITTHYYAKTNPREPEIKIKSFKGDKKDAEELETIKKWKFNSGAFWMSYAKFLNKIKKKQRIDIELIKQLKQLKSKLQDELIQKVENPGKIVQALIENSISGNHNTFDSIHLRQNIETKQDEEFWLHHILMDFTYSEK